MKKSIFTLLVVSLLLASCNDFLNELPKGEIVAKTTEDFRKLLDNADTRYIHNLVQSSSYVGVTTDNSHVNKDTWELWTDKSLHAHQLYSFADEVWLPDG